MLVTVAMRLPEAATAVGERMAEQGNTVATVD